MDWAAHLGGLVAGYVVGVAVFACSIKTVKWRIFWFVVGIALAVVTFYLTAQHLYGGNIKAAEELRDVCGYYKQFFEDYECKCMREQQQ